MHYVYECSVCEVTLTSSFFLCSNCHVTCFDCYSDSRSNHCSLCNLGQVYCCEFSQYRLGNCSNFGKTNGPVVILPDAAGNRRDIVGEPTGEPTSCPMCCNKLMKCFDCRKCIFMSRVLEHYVREHNGRLICPVPPGSMITFQMKSDDFKVGRVEILHLLQLMDTSDNASSSGDDQMLSEGDEKLLFLMGTKVPFFRNKFETMYMIKLWLITTFHACNTNYSLEVKGTKHDSVSLIFTGAPINVSQMEQEPNSEENWMQRLHILSVRESVVQHLENNGGCTVNFYIHQNDWAE